MDDFGRRAEEFGSSSEGIWGRRMKESESPVCRASMVGGCHWRSRPPGRAVGEGGRGAQETEGCGGKVLGGAGADTGFFGGARKPRLRLSAILFALH